MHFKADRINSAVRMLATAIAMSISFGLFPLALHAIAGERISVLVSSQDAPFEEALSGFQKTLAKQGIEAEYDIHRLGNDGVQAEAAAKKARSDSPGVVLTLGSLATDAAIRQISDTPIIACLVLRPDMLRHAPNATGVVLEFPLEVQFQWLQAMLPDAKSVGVLYNPEENEERIKAASRMARSRGMRLDAREVYTLQDVPSALAALSKTADVVWGLADNLALSPQIAKHILLFSFRNSIPFVGPSAAWVKAGALYSLDWDNADLGAQCGEMAIKVLKGARPDQLPPATPRMVRYSVNLKTAQQMQIPISERIIEGARSTY